jgi:hypothetical protein
MAADNDKSSSVSQSLLLATAILLAVVSGMAGLVHTVAELGPQVGDVVAFDPAHPAAFESVARLTAERSRQPSCVLDLASIQHSGGSLVLEQRGTNGPDRSYRAHWAGPRTSEGAEDCGRDADLVLTRMDVNALASAAGGFGARHAPGSLLR